MALKRELCNRWSIISKTWGHVMQGCLALDIDGTLTDGAHALPDKTRCFLEQSYQQGWQLLFITGRTYAFGILPLKPLQVPFCFAPQQGSLLLEMPEKRIICRHDLPHALLYDLSKLCESRAVDLVAFAGFETGDKVYYVKSMVRDLSIQKGFRPRGGEVWNGLNSWADFPVSSFPLARISGARHECRLLASRLAKLDGIHVTQIKDPFDPDDDLILITDAQAHKGAALKSFLDAKGWEHLPVIAAGNDNNDIQLLQEATVAIAISGSPQELLAHADIVAAPVAYEGIVPALQAAMQTIAAR